MSTTVPIPQPPQRFPYPQTAMRVADAQPAYEPDLAEAEEEEFALLWAADRGNQGA